MRLLVTGANGSIGRAICRYLLEQGHEVTGVTRNSVHTIAESTDRTNASLTWVNVSDIGATTDWSGILTGIDVVIHLAARAHVLHETAAAPLSEFRAVNTLGTLNLAQQAANFGVGRFVFISSIGVNGNRTDEEPFTEQSKPLPHDWYAISKYEAELGLQQLAQSAEMEIVVIRPPLVYGPGMKGNFASLTRWTQRAVPLPLGAIFNKRSLVALSNLVNFISLCADRSKSPRAGNETFLIADGEDVSTTELLRKVAKAYGKKPWLIPVPATWLQLAAQMLGKKAMADRLLGSLQVDASKARDLLGWHPIVTMDEQLQSIANDTTYS